jgi:hypothetical protein
MDGRADDDAPVLFTVFESPKSSTGELVITRTEARAIVDRRLLEKAQRSGIPLAVLEEETLELESGWVFYWDSLAFVETGETCRRLAGDVPFFVNRSTAELVELRKNVPWPE